MDLCVARVTRLAHARLFELVTVRDLLAGRSGRDAHYRATVRQVFRARQARCFRAN
jgi:hypothetical protein